jgi:cold-inducible RNA-binding protein
MSMKLYVGNLLLETSSLDLEHLFKQAGAVESVQIATTPTGHSRGYGFVEMSSEEEGASAIVQFNGREFQGSQLIVNEEKPPMAAAAGVSFGGSQRRKENSYSASRAIRWHRP